MNDPIITLSSVEKKKSDSVARDVFALDLAAVSAYLRPLGFVLDKKAGATRLGGGLSNLNYLVVVNGEKVVLRRPPAGELPVGAHDMQREHRVLSKLSKVFSAAPDSFHLCADKSVIGAHFQLLEFRSGLVVRGDELPEALHSDDARRDLSRELVRMLAALHAVDAPAAGLGDLGRPDGFYERNVEGWIKRSSYVATPSSQTTINDIARWLRAQRPRSLAPTLLHSDFKLDNCMLSPAGEITTILDWDMGTRGDPLMDLATLMSYWTEEGDPPCMIRLAQMPTAKPGFWKRNEAIADYAKITGRDLSDYLAWRALALFKLGVVFLQLHRNWTQGVAGDERYADFHALGGDLLAYTLHIIRRER